MLEDLILEVETEDSYVQPQHCLSTFQVVFTHDEDSEYTKLPTNQPVGRLISFSSLVGMLQTYTSGAIAGTGVRSAVHADVLVVLVWSPKVGT